MKPVSHQYEDKLLDFAYGELPAHEASAVESHVKTCARCTGALDQIRSVRTAMSAMPSVAAPDKGLDSLLAYAEQAARRNAEAAAPLPFFGRWKKWIAPLAGVTAVLLVGGVYLKAQENIGDGLKPENAALEVAKKADDAKYAEAPSAAPVAPKAVVQAAPEPQAADVPAEVAAAVEAKPVEKLKLKEGGESEALEDAVDAKKAPERSKLAKKHSNTQQVISAKGSTLQRDDKELLSVGNEAPVAGGMKAQNAPGLAVDQSGKGGGTRELDMNKNYYEPRQAGGGGTAASGKNAELRGELEKADKAEEAKTRPSANYRSAPAKVATKDRAPADDLSKQINDNSEGFRANSAPAAPATKSKAGKKSKGAVEIADGPGGGEITRPPTGSLSSEVARKTEAKPEPAKTAPAPVVAAAEKPADKKADEKTVAAKEASSGASSWGTSTGENAKKPATESPYAAQYGDQRREQQYGLGQGAQQQAAPQPPPPAQVASNTSSQRKSIPLGIQAPSRSSAGDEEINGADTAGPPSMKSNEIATQRQARQVQLADLMKQARSAANAGDIKQELKLCLELLQNDAAGDLRAEGLYRMCGGYRRLGLEDQAQPYCDTLQSQFPNSTWAAQTRSEQKNDRAMKPSPPKKSSRQADEQYERPAPSQASPPEPTSKPADALHAY